MRPAVRRTAHWASQGCPLPQQAACGGASPYFDAGAEVEVLGAGTDAAGAGTDAAGAGVEVVDAGAGACFAGAEVALLGVGVMAAWVWAGRHSRALFFMSHWTLRSVIFKPSPTLTW